MAATKNNVASAYNTHPTISLDNQTSAHPAITTVLSANRRLLIITSIEFNRIPKFSRSNNSATILITRSMGFERETITRRITIALLNHALLPTTSNPTFMSHQSKAILNVSAIYQLLRVAIAISCSVLRTTQFPLSRAPMANRMLKVTVSSITMFSVRILITLTINEEGGTQPDNA